MKLKYGLTKKKKKLLVKYFFSNSNNIEWNVWSKKSNSTEYIVKVKKLDQTVENYFMKVSKSNIEVKKLEEINVNVYRNKRRLIKRKNYHFSKEKSFWYVCGRDKNIKREIIKTRGSNEVELDHENYRVL